MNGSFQLVFLGTCWKRYRQSEQSGKCIFVCIGFAIVFYSLLTLEIVERHLSEVVSTLSTPPPTTRHWFSQTLRRLFTANVLTPWRGRKPIDYLRDHGLNLFCRINNSGNPENVSTSVDTAAITQWLSSINSRNSLPNVTEHPQHPEISRKVTSPQFGT